MSSVTLFNVAHLLLPNVLVKYFDMSKYKIKGQEIHFYFTEPNEISENIKILGFIPKASYKRLQFKIFLFKERKFPCI